MECLRTAVIGLGGIAGSHLSAIRQLNGRFELVAGVDPRGPAATNASPLGDVPLFADEAELYENVPDIHAVAICTPHNLHIHNIRSAVAHGVRGILTEKPVTTTLADMDEVIDLAERHNVRVSVGYILRHNPLFIKMHQLVEAGTYGAPFAVTCRTEQGWSGQWFDDKPWIKTNEGLGRGGSLFSHGCHYVDLMIWMMGRPVKGAKVSTKIAQGDRMEGPDTSFAIFQFERGGIGTMFSSWGVRHCESAIDYRLYCQGAQFIYDHRYDGTMDLFVVEQTGVRTRIDASDVGGGGPDAFTGTKNFIRQYRRFYDCVVEGVDPEPGLRTARQSMEAILDAVDAHEENRLALWPNRRIVLPSFRPIETDARYEGS
jgi:predicted dehydrogenase